MNTARVGIINSLSLPPQDRAKLRHLEGNCQAPLVHRGPLSVSATQPSGATDGITFNSFVEGQGDQSFANDNYGRGPIHLNGQVEMYGPQVGFIPLGMIVPFVPRTGGPTLAEVLAGGTWAVCDGTNGTPDLRGRLLAGYSAGDADFGTVSGTGGAKTHTNAFTTASGGSGTSGSNTTGVTTQAASGTTGSATTGISITHSTTTTSSSTTGLTTNSATVPINDPHDHAVDVTVNNVASGADVACIATIDVLTTSLGSTSHSHGVTDTGHTHTFTATHTVTDTGHTHTLGSHTHTMTDPGHTHTTPAHTHTGTTDSASHLPPYYTLYWLQRIA